MAMPTFTMRSLLEAGVHFGHHPRRWNPKMAPYLFGVRNNVHVINLEHTVPLLYRALEATRDVVKSGGRILFVGTKRQASPIVATAAKRCGQYYVNHRWLGGMLTNWKTISHSIKRLVSLNERLDKDHSGLTKKEILRLMRERDKLALAIGGIQEMGGLPNLLVVIDTNKEATAIKEANKLGIPVIGVVDSNSDPEGITYLVPGNDDATRAIELYCDLLSSAVLDGLQSQMLEAGIDMGASIEVLNERFGQDDSTMAVALADDPNADKVKKAAIKTVKKGTSKSSPVTKASAGSAEKMQAEAQEISETEPRKPSRKTDKQQTSENSEEEQTAVEA